MPKLNPYVILAELAIVLGLCFGSYQWGSHNESLVFEAYKSQQASKAEEQVADNKGALLDQERQQSAALAKIVQDQKGNINEITQRRDALLADNQHLSLQLRRFLTGSSSTAALVSSSTAGTQGLDGASDAAFSERLAKLSEFNTAQFGAADLYIAQISALQAVVAEDRKICNGVLPGVGTKKSADAVPPTSAQPPA
jgi:hypothetical protein